MSLTSPISELLIGSPGFNLCKIQNIMSQLSQHPMRDNCLCFGVFCWLFLITVDIQHQDFYSIITQSNNINSQKYLNSLLIPKFSNILGMTVCDITVKSLFKSTIQKTHNYYNANGNKILVNIRNTTDSLLFSVQHLQCNEKSCPYTITKFANIFYELRPSAK